MFVVGLIVVNEMEKLAYSEKKIEKNPWLLDDDKPVAEAKVGHLFTTCISVIHMKQ